MSNQRRFSGQHECKEAAPIQHATAHGASETHMPTRPAVAYQHALLNPRALAPADIRALQRTIGGLAVGRLLAGRIPAQSVEIQRKERGLGTSLEAMPQEEDSSAEVMRQAAQVGMQTSPSTLPYVRQIQQSFGRYDVSQIQAHLGPKATVSAESMQAAAYTTGEHVVFAGTPDLHIAAHEAAHVVQQRGDVQLSSGIGRVGDVYEQHAEAVADRVRAGQSAENLLDRMAGEPVETQETGLNSNVKKSSLQRETKIIQRHIWWDGVANQFVIDGTRPGWMGTVGALAPGAFQSRDHIVPFETIQNELCISLNNLLVFNTLANQQHLIDQTEALFPTASPDRWTMRVRRQYLITAINLGQVANYHAGARALLSSLNSSPDNVRLGNSALNLSIGENLDADFNPGTFPFGGGNCQTSAGVVMIAPQPVLTLTPASNTTVYAYQTHTDQPMSFVLGLLPIPNRQLSSVVGPTAGGGLPVGMPPIAPLPLPVLVTDPTGANLPYLYQ